MRHHYAFCKVILLLLQYLLDCLIAIPKKSFTAISSLELFTHKFSYGIYHVHTVNCKSWITNNAQQPSIDLLQIESTSLSVLYTCKGSGVHLFVIL